MPLQIPQPTLKRERIGGFLGINLRRDRLSLADTALASAINCDLHTFPGVIRPRAGYAILNATVLAGEVRYLRRFADKRFAVADGIVYQDFVSLITGLDTGLVTITAMFPRSEEEECYYVANAALSPMQKIRDGVAENWGIAGPTVDPVASIGAAGTLTGAYRAKYTYVRKSGDNLIHESTPSDSSNAVTLSSDQLNVTVTASSDPQVTYIYLYRTVAGGSSYLFDQQVANATATVSSTQADTALGAEVEADNAPPPTAAFGCTFQEHLFLLADPEHLDRLYYSKRFRPESFPLDNFIIITSPSDPLQCAVPLTGFLGVFTRQTKFRIFGNTVSGFAKLEAMSTRGTPAPQAVLATTRGALFVARDGIFSTSFVDEDTELTQALQPLFYGESVNDYLPIDWDRADEMMLAEWKQRLYFGYHDTDGTRMIAVFSRDTGHWYHYQIPARTFYNEEQSDLLLMGGTDGVVYTAETGTLDNGQAIAFSMQGPTRFLQDFTQRKRFDWLRTDIAGPVTLSLYIDGVLREIRQITGTRQRRLHRLRGILGQTWEVRLSGVTAGTAVHSVDILALPLEIA